VTALEIKAQVGLTAKEVWWIVLSILLFVCLTTLLLAKLVRQSQYRFPCKFIEELRLKAASINMAAVSPEEEISEIEIE